MSGSTNKIAELAGNMADKALVDTTYILTGTAIGDFVVWGIIGAVIVMGIAIIKK